MDQLDFLSEEPLASPSQSQVSEEDWMTTAVTWPSSILNWLKEHGPHGWFGRMCPVSCQAAEDGTLVPFSGAWSNSGMGSPTECLTHNISEFHKDAGVCLLSDILETGDLPPRFFLSARACSGILRRAEKRGKKLPEQLERALAEKARETDVAQTVMAGGPVGGNQGGDYIAHPTVAIPISTQNATRSTEADASTGMGVGEDGEAQFTISKNHEHAVAFEPGILKRDGAENRVSNEVSPTLRSNMGDNQPAVAWSEELTAHEELAGTVQRGGEGGRHDGVMNRMQVRRLTPVECERLQGFPDNYTQIEWRGKEAENCPDGPRYKALGNSMAVPVMTWIGERIQKVEDMINEN